MVEFLCFLVDAYVLIMILRMVLSFFPMSPESPLAKASAVLQAITEPLLAPLRRVIPPLGAFDLSPLVLLILLRVIVQGLILGC